jgi:hypothetical protein
MNRRAEELSARQVVLSGQAAAQRIELAEIQASLAEPLAWMQRGLGVVNVIRAHPQIAVLTTLAISLTFGRHLTKIRNWLVGGLAVHQLYKTVGARLLPLLTRHPSGASDDDDQEPAQTR